MSRAGSPGSSFHSGEGNDRAASRPGPGSARSRPLIAVGVAGWDYPDWRETVYRLPQPAFQPGLFPELSVASAKPRYPRKPLAFLRDYLDMIEINSTFYRIPAPRISAEWARCGGEKPGFFFTAKLAREFTHEFRRDAQLARAFRRGLAPLAEAGLLRAILVQFRYDFADSPESRALLEWLAAEFAEFARPVVEVRHASWQERGALAFFGERGLCLVNLDYPGASTGFGASVCVTPALAYLRLHGRNREAWFKKTAKSYEPYDYDYADSEIAEIARRTRALGARAEQTVVVANNHYRGKAVSAALRLKAMLSGRRVAVPPALLAAYPNLEKIARNPGPA